MIATCPCGHPLDENWFDRTICPDPCGSMHTRCNDCGRAQGGCPHEQPARVTVEQVARIFDVPPEMLVDTGNTLCPRSDLPVEFCAHCRTPAEWDRSFKAEASQRGRDHSKGPLLGRWFRAAWPGSCSRCDKRFEAGEDIRRDWPEDTAFIRKACHETAKPRRDAA